MWHLEWDSVDGRILGCVSSDLNSSKISKSTRMTIKHFQSMGFEVDAEPRFAQYMSGEARTYAIVVKW